MDWMCCFIVSLSMRERGLVAEVIMCMMNFRSELSESFVHGRHSARWDLLEVHALV